MKSCIVLGLAVAVIIGITAGVVLSKSLTDEIDLVFIEWENETEIGSSLISEDTEASVNLAPVFLDDGSHISPNNYEIMEKFEQNSTKIYLGWMLVEGEEAFDPNNISCLNAMFNTLGISCVVGIISGSLSCVIVLIISRIRSASSITSYNRLDKPGQHSDHEMHQDIHDVEEVSYKPRILLLVWCVSSITASLFTALFIVFYQILKLDVKVS